MFSFIFTIIIFCALISTQSFTARSSTCSAGQLFPPGLVASIPWGPWLQWGGLGSACVVTAPVVKEPQLPCETGHLQPRNRNCFFSVCRGRWWWPERGLSADSAPASCPCHRCPSGEPQVTARPRHRFARGFSL